MLTRRLITTRNIEKYWQSFAAVVVLGSIGLVCWLVARYGVNVPFMDEWDFVHTIEKYRAGILSLSDLAASHNEHRVLFPRLLFLASTITTGWNIRMLLAVTVVLAFFTTLLLIQLFRTTAVSANNGANALLIALIAAQAFSLAQWVNWLWAWDVQWWMVVTSLVTAVVLLRDAPLNVVRFVASVLAAAIATFSLASGMFVWLSVLPLLISRTRRKWLTAWCIAAAVVIGFYFYGYKSMQHHGPLADSFTSFAGVLQFIAYFAGNTLSLSPDAGLLTIVSFLLASASAISDPSIRARALPWFSLGLFTLLTGAVIALGRVRILGPEAGLESRYATVSFLLVVSTAALIVLSMGTRTAKVGQSQKIMVVVLLALVLMTLGRSYESMPQFARRSAELSNGLACVRNLDAASDDCLKQLFPDPMVVRSLAPKLKSSGWSGAQGE